jgi:hypothetical protein
LSPDGSSQTLDSDVGSSHTIGDGGGSYSIVATLEDGSEETIRTITSSARYSVLSGTVSYNSPVEGVLVESYDSEGNLVDSDLTNANGVYNVKEADELRVNNFTASYGDVDLNTVASNEGTSVPSILMKGDGSSSSPYEISTASDLQAMQEDISANYIVVNDIDASGTVNWNNGQGFNPVGTYEQTNSEFTGSFDGKKYDISGLNIKRQSEGYVGLFGAIGAGGEVKNVGVINVNMTGDNIVGSLAGNNNGTVSNSYSTGNVTGENVTSESYYVGGLVGSNYGTVSNSHSTGNVTGAYDVGGLVGRNDGTVSNSDSTGNVSGKTSVGGLVGLSTTGTVEKSYSTGNVSGKNSVAGLVGFNDGNISNSYSTGNVTGEFERVGGLVGYNFGGTVSNSYSTGNVSSEEKVGGLVGENDNGMVSNSYSTGNVTGGDNNVGGLVGNNSISSSGSVSDSYWDTETSNQPTSAGSANGLTTAEMTGSSAEGNMNFDFTSTWSTVTGDYPELQE